MLLHMCTFSASFCEFLKPQAAGVWVVKEVPATCLLLKIAALTKDCRAGCGSMCPHDRLQVFFPAVVWRSSARLLLLMTVLSTQLSGSLSSFMELLMLSKLQQCEVDGSNYKVSRVGALRLPPSFSSLSLMLHITALFGFLRNGSRDYRRFVCFDFTLNKYKYSISIYIQYLCLYLLQIKNDSKSTY